MRDLGVAIIGAGFMSWVHLEALQRVGATVTGICGSTADKSRAAAEKLGLAKAYGSLDEILADSSVDSVHIVTPNRCHFEMAKKTLAADKHVLCEKPLAMTASESAELVALAKAKPQLAAGVNYNIRYYPLCLEARELIRAGRIGRLVHVTGSYTQDWLAYPTDYNWRVLAQENGELRTVADVGTHWLDLMSFITGLEVESLSADLLTVHPCRERPCGEVATFQNKEQAPNETESVEVTTDDFGAILLRYGSGVRGSLHVSQVTHGRKNCVRFEIVGSQGTLAWNSEEPNQLWIGHRDQANELLIRDPALLSEPAPTAADYPGGHNEGYPDSFKQCFRRFYQAIDQNDFTAPPAFPTFADGHREIALCEAVSKSNRERRWVSL